MGNGKMTKFQKEVINTIIKKDRLTNLDYGYKEELELFICIFKAIEDIYLHYNQSRANEVIHQYIVDLEGQYYQNDDFIERFKNWDKHIDM